MLNMPSKLRKIPVFSINKSYDLITKEKFKNNCIYYYLKQQQKKMKNIEPNINREYPHEEKDTETKHETLLTLLNFSTRYTIRTNTPTRNLRCLLLDNTNATNSHSMMLHGININKSYCVERNLKHFKTLKKNIIKKKIPINICYSGVNEVIQNLKRNKINIFYLDLMDTFEGGIFAKENKNSTKDILINTLNKTDECILGITFTTRNRNGEKYEDAKKKMFDIIEKDFNILHSEERNGDGNCKTWIFDIKRKCVE